MKLLAVSFAALCLLAEPAWAQGAPRPSAVAAAPYPGTIQLSVDATDVDRRIYRVKETVPVAGAGRLTLLYPQWLPGNHAPTGQLEKFAGLTVSAGGRRIAWRRDPIDLYAFHVEVPAGVRALDLEFQFLSATEANQLGRIVMSPQMLDLQWQQVLLYPKGYPAKAITVQPSVTLPADWSQASALRPQSEGSGATVAFAPVSLETLIDSPMFAGRWYRSYDHAPGARTPVQLNVFAETPERAEATPAQIDAHRALVVQADKLFGGVRRFDRYDFLLALTRGLSSAGIEHLRSSENITVPDYFSDWAKSAPSRTLLPHEYSHSWNGKHTRPRGLEQADYNTPVDAGLLWVYEGLTEYWGVVLGARSGLITAEQARAEIAELADTFALRSGRSWRSVLDTTVDPAVAYRRPKGWGSWQRGTDYYGEGALVWLEADVLIRERSGGRRSLDDFARAFFGRAGDGAAPVLYDRADVVAALNAVQPYDWNGFLRERIEAVGAPLPVGGIERGGYRLAYGDTPTAAFVAGEAASEVTDLSNALGMTVRRDGTVAGVIWEGQAFDAKLINGARILAVNGVAHDDGRLRAAVSAKGPVELIVRQGDAVRTVRLDASAGFRYPRLERIPATPGRLDEILAARK